MKFNVEYIDAAGKTHKRVETVSRLQFLKSFAIAGQGSLPSPKTFSRMIGAFLFYADYLEWNSLLKGRFSGPPAERRDPTERNQFSNQAGKAIADLLARRIHGAKVTYNYEAAMLTHDPPFKIKGSRPDFLCDTGTQIIAIEAKGFASGYVSKKTMARVKVQSRQGPLSKDATVACVAYGLYSNLRAKYHDPDEDQKGRDERFCRQLAKEFYSGLFGFLRDRRFQVSTITIQDRNFLRVALSPETEPWAAIMQCASHRLGFKSVALLIAYEVKRVVQDGNIDMLPPHLEAPGVWIDDDGVGIELLENERFEDGRREPTPLKDWSNPIDSLEV